MLQTYVGITGGVPWLAPLPPGSIPLLGGLFDGVWMFFPCGLPSVNMIVDNSMSVSLVMSWQHIQIIPCLTPEAQESFRSGFPSGFHSVLTSLSLCCWKSLMLQHQASDTILVRQGAVPGFFQTWWVKLRPKFLSWFQENRWSCFSQPENPSEAFKCLWLRRSFCLDTKIVGAALMVDFITLWLYK